MPNPRRRILLTSTAVGLVIVFVGILLPVIGGGMIGMAMLVIGLLTLVEVATPV